MKKLRIGVIGLGSIGIRHIENLVVILNKRKIGYEIDVIRSGEGKPIPNRIKDLVRKNIFINDAKKEFFDIIFITNPTSLHFETLQNFKSNSKAFFIEKPVFNTSEVDLTGLNLDKNIIIYVACPLRYTSVIEYLKNNIDIKDVFSARIISSSYLPEWRPEIDYRETYSAIKELGGGVSIDLIHEWDYLYYLFGEPEEIASFKGKYSNLEINTDDLAVSIVKYPDKIVEIHLDYLGRFPIREIQLFMEKDVIIGDLINSEVRFLKSGNIVRFDEIRNDYQQKEIERFIDVLNGKEKNHNDLQTALKVLKLAKEK